MRSARTQFDHATRRGLESSRWWAVFHVFLLTAWSANGCVGGFPDLRQQPDGRWKGPTTRLSLPATRPVTNSPKDRYDFEVGITGASPDQIIVSARSLLEPTYGRMKYIKRDIPNGRTGHLLLSPRYEVSNLGLDYKWLEVRV